MAVLTLSIRETSTLRDATFTTPDLTTFTGWTSSDWPPPGSGSSPTAPSWTAASSTPMAVVPRVRLRGPTTRHRDRRLAHVPFGWRPTVLSSRPPLRLHRLRRVWRQDTSRGGRAEGHATRSALQWALFALVIQHLTVARVADALDVAWDTANNAVLDEGRRLLISDPTRFTGVRVIGVDEHVWRHTRAATSSSPPSSTSPPSATGPAPHGCWTWSRAAPRRRSRPGSPTARRPGATASRSSRWTGSPASRPPPPRSSPPPPPCSTRSTWCASPRTLWISAAAGSSRPSTATVAARATPSTRRGRRCTPAPSCSPSGRPPGCARCSPTPRRTTTPRSMRPGASTSG